MRTSFHLYAVIGLLLALTVTSCRKGEDDPLVSVRSRDARLTGTWQLNSMKSFSSFSDELTFEDESYTYADVYRASLKNGKLVSYSESSSMFPEDSTSSVHVSQASIQVEIKEDGTFTYTETYQPMEAVYTYWEYDYYTGKYNKVTNREKLDEQTDTYSVTGFWYWEDSYHDKAMVHLEGLGTHYLSGLRNEAMTWEYHDGFSMDDADSSVVFSMRSGLSVDMLWTKE